MKATLLLLLVVGLVSCIPRESYGSESLDAEGDGSSDLVLRSYPFVRPKRGFWSSIRRKKPKEERPANERQPPRPAHTQVDPEVLVLFNNTMKELKQHHNKRFPFQRTLRQLKPSKGRSPSNERNPLDTDYSKLNWQNNPLYKPPSRGRNPLNIDYSKLNWQNNPAYKPPHSGRNPLDIDYSKLNWQNNPAYKSPHSGSSGGQYMGKRGFFDKMKEKYRRRKQSKQDRQQRKHRNKNRKIRHDDDDDDDEDDDSGYGANYDSDGRDDDDDYDRYRRSEVLERALRNTVFLSSNLNLDVEKNKTSPSAATVIKEVDENQLGKADGGQSEGEGVNKALAGENEAGQENDSSEESDEDTSEESDENDDDSSEESDEDNSNNDVVHVVM